MKLVTMLEKIGSNLKKVRGLLLGDVSATVGLVTGLAGIIGAIAAAWWSLVLFAASGEFDVVVWVQGTEALYPSKSTGNLSLPLSFDGSFTKSATIVQVNIANLSSREIGRQDALWELRLNSGTGSKIIPFEEPQSKPSRTVVVINEPVSDVLSLGIGVLQPGAQIYMRLLLIDVERPMNPRLVADWDLVGLPKPEVTTLSLKDRLFERFIDWVFVVTLVILVGFRAYEVSKKPGSFDSRKATISTLAKSVLLVLVGSTFYTFIAAKFRGWLAAQTLHFFL